MSTAAACVDGDSVDDDSALDGWFQRDWGHDAPVLLVDMAPLNAWVTSVKTGRAGGSRLNFLSATVSVDIAERLLRPDRPDLPLGERARVLIGSPYRPQARLVNLLIKDAGLEREVVPGTAHTFQGSEAPVVIFDLVLDEPHRQAGLFDPRRNEDNLRLLNVALTRARRRLIVLGDFNWVEQHANRHSSLRELVHFLRDHYPLVSALDVVTDGLQTRAAEAHQLIVGGDDAPSHRRIVVTQEHFYPLLVRDIDAAAGTSLASGPTHRSIVRDETLGRLRTILPRTGSATPDTYSRPPRTESITSSPATKASRTGRTRSRPRSRCAFEHRATLSQRSGNCAPVARQCAPVLSGSQRISADDEPGIRAPRTDRNPASAQGFGLFKRRGRDLNPRPTEPPVTVFETAAFDRSATPPRGRQRTGHSQKPSSTIRAPGEVAEWLKAAPC